MPIQPVYNGPPQASAAPLSLNLEPGTTITIKVDKTGGSQASVSSSSASAPEDRVTIGSQDLPPSRYNELNAKYSSQYPGAKAQQGSVLKPPQPQASSKPTQAQTQQPQRLQPLQSQAQSANWLPPSSYSDMDRTLQRYYINPPAQASGGSQDSSQGIASDIATIASSGSSA